MKPAPFRYLAPTGVEEAVELLREHGAGAKLLAGGQSLVPLMNLRLAQPSVLVDLNRVPGLRAIAERDGRVVVGAMARHRDVASDPIVGARCPILAHAAARIGYPAIRNRGTIGGSLAHADPVAEMPCVALALDAELVAVGPAGERVIPASAFFEGLFQSALAPTEVLTEIRFPVLDSNERWGFEEFARKTGDYAICASAVRVHVAKGVVERARIALAGVADRPVRATAAERLLVGRPPDTRSRAETVEAVRSAVENDGGREVGGYRAHLAGVLTGRALASAGLGGEA